MTNFKKSNESHEQFKNLSDEQNERIEGKAYLQTLDEGRNGSQSQTLGRSGQESQRSNENGGNIRINQR